MYVSVCARAHVCVFVEGEYWTGELEGAVETVTSYTIILERGHKDLGMAK